MTNRMRPGYGRLSNVIREIESWDYAEATKQEKAAKESFLATPGDENPTYVSPLEQWHCWNRELPRMKQQYEDSEDFKLVFEAITRCIAARLPMPAWCAKPIRDAWIKIESFKHRSWDEVLGKPHPNINLANARRWSEIQLPAVLEARDLIEQGREVLETLRNMAERHSVSFEQMRSWYYAHLKEFPTSMTLTSNGELSPPESD